MAANFPILMSRIKLMARSMPKKNNAVLICHALTGDAEPYFDDGRDGWWQNFMGAGLALDTDRYFLLARTY